MSKEETVELEGRVVEARAGSMFTVEFGNGHQILAHLSGRMRQNKIRIAVGDRVRVEMTPYDLERGRISYRL